MSWTPPFDPKSRQEVIDFSEAKRRPLIRRAALALGLVGLICLSALVFTGAPLICWWATGAIFSLVSLFALDRYGPQASYSRALRKTVRLYGDSPREGVQSDCPHARLKATGFVDHFGRRAVGVGIWRSRSGVWNQAGWNERPQFFDDPEQAEAFEQALAEEL